MAFAAAGAKGPARAKKSPLDGLRRDSLAPGAVSVPSVHFRHSAWTFSSRRLNSQFADTEARSEHLPDQTVPVSSQTGANHI